MILNSISIWFSEHSLTVLLTIATIFTVFWLLQFCERLKMKWYAATLLSLLHVAYGVCCVRFFASLEGSSGGMSLFGAVFFMPLGYWIGAKIGHRSLEEVFDIFAIAMIMTLFCARCNCLVSGCCLGQVIRPGSPARWPTREIELIFYAVFLAQMIPKVIRGKTYGRVYPLFMFAYGAFRFVIEFFRVSQSASIFHIAHLWSGVSIVIGATLYFTIVDRMKKPKKRNG